MDKIISHLKETISDEHLSKPERQLLKSLVAELNPNQDQLNFLRSKIYELAGEKATETNYQFILEWVRAANNALLISATPSEKTHAFFSPGEECRNAIIYQINKSINQLKICVFTISDDTITQAIVAAHKKGRQIKVITDNDKSLDMGSDIERMAKEGIAVKIDNTANHMHHKFMVVDDRNVITGSYNWTQSAARYNHENILLTNEAGVVKSFLNEFDQLWSEMSPY